jgi:hypothetical protein
MLGSLDDRTTPCTPAVAEVETGERGSSRLDVAQGQRVGGGQAAERHLLLPS